MLCLNDLSSLVTKASDVTIRPIKWIWEPYIVDKNVNLLGGTGGTGKTFFIAALTSAITTGMQPEDMPGTVRSVGNVLYLGSEDGNEEVTSRHDGNHDIQYLDRSVFSQNNHCCQNNQGNGSI